MNSDEYWVQTYTGKKFWPLSPDAEHLDIQDVAHALSMICRFNGHCLKFYSVAQHCFYVSVLLEKHLYDSDFWEDENMTNLEWAYIQMWGLLHDLPEAYLTDVPAPIKEVIPDFRSIENKILEVVATKWDLGLPMPEIVKVADLIMLHTEKNQLMSESPSDWNLPYPPAKLEIWAWDPPNAKEWFLMRFDLLHGRLIDARRRIDAL
jgi:hypothetical protein